MSLYDAVAPNFDRHRAIPDAAVEAIRAAMLAAINPVTRPRFLDIGAGTGRIGLPFVAAGNDYVGVDSSLEMLYQFAERSRRHIDPPPSLVQSDGQFLPFRDATFDAVMLIQIFGGLRGPDAIGAKPVSMAVCQVQPPAVPVDPLRRHYLDAITSERWTASDWNRWTPQVRYAWTASLESAAWAHAMSFHGFHEC